MWIRIRYRKGDTVREGHLNPIEPMEIRIRCPLCHNTFLTRNYRTVCRQCEEDYVIPCTGCGKIHGAESCYEHAMNEAEYKGE